MRLTTLTLLTAILVPMASTAEGASVRPVTDSLVKKECGACHMAFAPTFLPVESWEKIVTTLDNHFGEDASLDAEPLAKIAAYLKTNAGRGHVDPATPPLRITELKGFRSRHSEGEVSWLRKKRNVKSMANCVACHSDAERGYFGDD